MMMDRYAEVKATAEKSFEEYTQRKIVNLVPEGFTGEIKVDICPQCGAEIHFVKPVIRFRLGIERPVPHVPCECGAMIVGYKWGGNA